MKITNKQRVIDYINEFGSITSLQAFNDLGDSRLSSTIFELKKDGYLIKSEDIKVYNRFGEPRYVAKYSFINE